MLAGGEFAERIGARAEIVIRVGEIGPDADQTDLELAAAPALADARVENGGLPARVRAHDQERVGLLDAGDGRIENVGGAAGFGVEGIAALDRKVYGAVPPLQLLQREHLLHRGEIARDGADPLAVAAGYFRRNRIERLVP